MAHPPRLAALLLRALLPRAERDEVLADLDAEFTARAGRHGLRGARHWFWRQTLRSLPALLRWTWWRGTTGYEPRSSAFHPRGPIVKNWLTDASYAARRLKARPMYTTIAVLTLALGIGGTSAIFGIARPLVFDPLPYAHEREVGTFWMPGWWTEEEFLYLRGKFSGFRAVGAYRPGDATMRNGSEPARLIPGVQVTSELFDVLGTRPVIGRSFQSGDDAQGAAPEVIVSYGLWRELGGTEAVVGRPITLNGMPHTIVGVMPKSFWFPSPDIRLWRLEPLDPQGRNGSYVLLGRAASGLDIGHMDAPIRQLTRIIGDRFTYSAKADKTRDAKVTPLRTALLGTMRPAVVATFVAMGLILLIACTNVAALMLGQVEGRATELAVRSALGATRGRIIQQLTIEALALGLLAGLVGGAFAAAGFHTVAQALPIGAWSDSSSFDWSTFAAALAIAVLAVLLVVLVPVMSVWRGNLRDTLNRARTGGIQGRGGRLEHGLVVVEVALAMLIATGAGLLVRSVANRYAIDPGINVRGVGVIDVSPGPEMKSRERRQKIEDVVRALSAVPGVKSAGAAMKLPLRGSGDSFGITIEGREHEPSSFTFFRVVTADYFATMGYRLRAGRLFHAVEPADSSEIPVIINEALAKKYFPGENPLGKRIGDGFGVPQRIIGIVGDAAEADLKTEAEPARYYLASLVPWFSAEGALVIRMSRESDAPQLLDAARRTVQQVAPSFAVQRTTTMQRVFDEAVGPVRQLMALLALLSAIALVLGAVGIYGVISHFASRRQRDWAIRVALGLPSSGVVMHVVRQGIGLAVLGVVAGAAAAALLARLLTSFLFGVNAVDPTSFAAATAVLLVIAMIAAFIPARRAGSVDPALVLREQ
ncbi:MAG TPA: ADOP family duplicated permease [Gemmatimonadaceae bacterium]|nr:ADOP family duplicated permease [Gemmatimonadaceae bacterium]